MGFIAKVRIAERLNVQDGMHHESVYERFV
jgi:hypothetical protein